MRRREDLEARRKQRKREWLLKMYRVRAIGVLARSWPPRVCVPACKCLSALTQPLQDGMAQERGGQATKAAREGSVGGVCVPAAPHDSNQSVPTADCAVGMPALPPIDFDSPDWEAEAEALLEWSTALDFDAYFAEWRVVGTSAPTEGPVFEAQQLAAGGGARAGQARAGQARVGVAAPHAATAHSEPPAARTAASTAVPLGGKQFDTQPKGAVQAAPLSTGWGDAELRM